MLEAVLTDQQQVRFEELKTLRELGVNPYPSEEFVTTHTAKELLEQYPSNPEAFKAVRVAGRILRKRIMGKASFAELHDASGKIQLYISNDTVATTENCSVYEDLFKKLTSLGDIVGVEGDVFTTKTGEISIKVHQYTILSKSLRPLPLPKEKDGVIYDAFTDPEQRYRMRYLDLIVNPGVRDVFIQRSRLVQAMRTFLLDKGYLEVETPILQPIYGGAYARPFTTHHNTLDTTLYLRIANELYLKRLIVGGFVGVFEFAKDFRNEGMSRFHNPEFTQMELYVAYKDYHWMMDLVESMVETVVIALHGKPEVQVGEQVISFKRPWQRYTFFGAIEQFTGKSVRFMPLNELVDFANTLGGEFTESDSKADILDHIFGETVEKNLIQPTFIIDYPLEMSPLAKKHRSEQGLVERFEVICNAKEIANAYSELNDPIDQRERLEAQLKLRESGNEEAMMLDEDFLRALEYGMPPTAGLGIGIDRLTMILTNQQSIQDVLFFPQMKPEKRDSLDWFKATGLPEAVLTVLIKHQITRAEHFCKLDPIQLQSLLNGTDASISAGLTAEALHQCQIRLKSSNLFI